MQIVYQSLPHRLLHGVGSKSCNESSKPNTHGTDRGELLVRVRAAQQDDVVQQIHEAPPDRFNFLNKPRRRAWLRLNGFYCRLTASRTHTASAPEPYLSRTLLPGAFQPHITELPLLQYRSCARLSSP